jgi:hypothetical protein
MYFKGLGSSVENRISRNLTKKNTTEMTHPITKILSIFIAPLLLDLIFL